MALVAEGTPGGVDVGRARVVGGPGRGWRAEEVLRPGDQGTPLPISEQPEVADADEAAREHVQQKTSEEFLDPKCHDFRAPPIGVILPLKLDPAVDERKTTDKALTGKRNAARPWIQRV